MLKYQAWWHLEDKVCTVLVMQLLYEEWLGHMTGLPQGHLTIPVTHL